MRRYLPLLLTLTLILGFSASLQAMEEEYTEWNQISEEAEALFKKGKLKEARKEFLRALLYIKGEAPNSRRHVQTFSDLARLALKMDEGGKAVAYLDKALKMSRRKLGKRSKTTFKIYEELADARTVIGQPQYSKSIYEDLVRLHHAKSPASSDSLRVMIKLANTYYAMDDTDQALGYFKRVVALAKKNQLDNAKMRDIYQRYIKVLRKAGKKKMVTKFEEIVLNLDTGNVQDKPLAIETMETPATNTSPSAMPDPNPELTPTATPSLSAPAPITTPSVNPSAIPSINPSVTTTPQTTFAPGSKAPVAKLSTSEGVVWLTTFINELAIGQQQYNVARQSMHSLCQDKRLTNKMAYCMMYWFNSGQKTQKGVYPKFTLRAVVYPDSTSALAARDQLKSSANPDTGLNYEWNHVVIKNNWLYWMQGGCVYSKQSWQTVLKQLHSSLGVSEGAALQKLNCKCGGGCTS